ncbi:MAG: hypothetical protein RLZZ292_1024 [Bacteroidota bacterium]|jgi:23S rRNA (cytidine1920-2'-O)/16S rRNA (cytidine1409-2'-O)-methyltransferase
MRLDSWLVQNNYLESREKAHLEIEAGNICINKKIAKKPSNQVEENDLVEMINRRFRFVSKEGSKLERAIQTFELDFSNKTVLDVGTGIGGFTDCALQYGATKVYALDTIANQLFASLRENEKVVFYEETDIRAFTLAQLDNAPVDIIVADVSYLSLTLVFPHLSSLLKADGYVIALIKPQFEHDPNTKIKKGVINDAKNQQQAILKVKGSAKEHGFRCEKMIETLVEDKKNLEFLGLWKKTL